MCQLIAESLDKHIITTSDSIDEWMDIDTGVTTSPHSACFEGSPAILCEME